MTKLSALQRAQLIRAYRVPTGIYIRAITAGDRVTLASLHSRGLLDRRAWRGDGISRNSAFEYTLTDQMRVAFDARRRSLA